MPIIIAPKLSCNHRVWLMKKIESIRIHLWILILCLPIEKWWDVSIVCRRFERKSPLSEAKRSWTLTTSLHQTVFTLSTIPYLIARSKKIDQSSLYSWYKCEYLFIRQPSWRNHFPILNHICRVDRLIFAAIDLGQIQFSPCQVETADKFEQFPASQLGVNCLHEIDGHRADNQWNTKPNQMSRLRVTVNCIGNMLILMNLLTLVKWQIMRERLLLWSSFFFELYNLCSASSR